MPDFGPLATFARRVGAVPPVPAASGAARTEADWSELLEERAAILEYEGGWSRAEAEQRAREEIAFRRFGRR